MEERKEKVKKREEGIRWRASENKRVWSKIKEKEREREGGGEEVE